MNWFDRLYFGTWQLGGQFKKLSFTYIESLLLFAIDCGIRRFDTAAVYGNGRVEEILGACLPKSVIIVTKVPAISKPDLKMLEPIQKFYSKESIHQSASESLERLKRSFIDVVLLHNWLPIWSENSIETLEHLNDLKNRGVTQRVGISLPDNFLYSISETVLPYIDVIEAPFNPEQKWILKQLPRLVELKKEIILRSLFVQGKLLTKYSVKSLIQDALKLETSFVIGMTTKEQIIENISYFKKEIK